MSTPRRTCRHLPHPSPRLLRTATAATCLGLLLAGCGGGSPSTPGQDGAAAPTADVLDDAEVADLVAQAEQEGRVVVYSFTSRIAAVEEAFEAEYPGIDLVATDISSTEQVARIRAEAQAGSPGADVAFLADAPVVVTELVASGLLRGYVPPRLAGAIPAEYQEPLLSQRLSTKVLMYNEEAHPDGSPVSNLWELTEPSWSGRVVMVDPAVRGDYLDLMTEIVLRSEEMADAYEEHTGEPIQLADGVPDAGTQWITDLYANDVVLVDDTDSVNAAVGLTGQTNPPVGFTSYSDRRDNEDEGWALQVDDAVVPAPGIAYPAYLALVEGAQNPAAARLFIDFAMGDDSETGGDAFEPFYVAGDYPTRDDLTAPQDAVSLDELGAWVIDAEEVAARRPEVADLLITLG